MNPVSLNRPPKHLELRETLRVALARGTYKPGERLPSEHEFVALYGVSRPTVREAIAALAQEGLVTRIQGRGTYAARAPAALRDVGFFLCGRTATDPLYSMTLRGAAAQCRASDLRLVYEHFENTDAISALERLVLEQRTLRGIVVTGLVKLKWLLRLLELQPNVVLVGDLLDVDPTPPLVVQVLATGFGAEEALAHLLQLGHRRIAHVTGDLRRPWFRRPCEAYQRILQDNGVPPDPRLIAECVDEGLDFGHQATSGLLDLPQRPTALLAANDRFAWGAVRAIRERQLRIPEDISVIGAGDLPLGDRRDFLTTVRVDWPRMGAIAVERVLANVGGQTDQVRIPIRLVVRKSCAPPPADARDPQTHPVG